jgi:hypothetical protein
MNNVSGCFMEFWVLADARGGALKSGNITPY